MSSLTPRIDNIEGRLPNIIINPEMRISQRGTFTSDTTIAAGGYSIDRWKNSFGGAGLTAKIRVFSTAQPTDLVGTSSLRYTALTATTTTGYLGSFQTIENYSIYNGKTVTASAYVKSNNTNARVGIWDGNSGNYLFSPNHTGDDTWQRLAVTVTIGAAGTPTTLFTLVRIENSSGNPVPIAIGDYIEFTGVKLELNDQVTPFVSRPVAEELILCQRYCNHCNAGSAGMCEGTTTAALSGKFPVPMRTGSVTLTRTATAVIRQAGGDYNSSGTIVTYSCTTYGWWALVPGFTGLTSNNACSDRGNSTWLLAEAEL